MKFQWCESLEPHTIEPIYLYCCWTLIASLSPHDLQIASLWCVIRFALVYSGWSIQMAHFTISSANSLNTRSRTWKDIYIMRRCTEDVQLETHSIASWAILSNNPVHDCLYWLFNMMEEEHVQLITSSCSTPSVWVIRLLSCSANLSFLSCILFNCHYLFSTLMTCQLACHDMDYGMPLEDLRFSQSHLESISMECPCSALITFGSKN